MVIGADYMRRYVAETLFTGKERGEIFRKVTIYPESFNLKEVEKEIGNLSARKGVLRSKNNKNWRFKEL